MRNNIQGETMSNLKEIIKAYEKLQEVIDANQEIFASDSDVQGIKASIKRLKLEDRFGAKLTCHGGDWYESYYPAAVSVYVGYYGGPHEREISWSDDGRQPENEWLYVLSFCTGPYIFGEGYPVNTFQDFFNELKAFGPKYSDTNNNTLYFTEEVSAKVHAALNPLYLKYKEQVNAEMKEKRKKELEAELAKLNGG